MFSSGFVGAFRRTPDQLFKHQAHIGIGDRFGTEIKGGKLLHHQKKQISVVKPSDLIFKTSLGDSYSSTVISHFQYRQCALIFFDALMIFGSRLRAVT
jgi:hypothetical protein